MNLASCNVLVTGAGGFVGSHLCEALARLGASVTAMIRYTSSEKWGNLEYLPPDVLGALDVQAGNVEDGDFMMRQVEGKDVVFHLAALIGIPYSYTAPRSYVRTNVEGTLNVLEAARRHDVGRVVHTSTSEAYGTALYTPIDEVHALQGQSPYSASKIGADKLAESYHRAFDLPVATLRPFNTYGPRQSARAIIPTVISQALTRDEIRLGALDPVRDLTYVQDTVGAFLATATSDAAVGQTINAGFGKGISIGDLVAEILDVMGATKPICTDARRVRPEKSEVYTLICNNARAKELVGWEPTTSLRHGLTETVEFIRRHSEAFKPEMYSV